MTLICKIDGTDYGPTGEGVVNSIDLQLSGTDQIGVATLNLVYPETQAYIINNMMKVEVYDTDDIVDPGFGYVAGVVSDRDEEMIKGTDPVQLLDQVSVQDANLALDIVRRGVHDGLTITAGTMQEQAQDLVSALQLNGHEDVNWPINTTDYTTNLVEGTLPAFSLHGNSMRDGLDRIMANARITDPTVNPGYNIQYRSNGTGDLEPCLVFFDKAAVADPSFVIASDADEGAGEWPIFSLARKTSSTDLVNAQENEWGSLGLLAELYTNDDSQAAYPNPWQNDGGVDDTGYVWAKALRDQDSGSSEEALSALEKSVKPKQFPIDSLMPTVDNIKIRPGQVVTLRIPERGIEGNYMVVGISISFPFLNNPSYTRTEITLGSRRLGLFDPGEDGEALPPDELLPTAPDAAVITGITSEQISLRFTATVTFTHNHFTTGLCLYRETEGDHDWQQVEILRQSGSPATVQVPGLRLGVEYEFYIILFDRFGVPSPDSNVVTHTPSAGEVDPPEISLFSNVYDRRLNRALIKVDRVPSTSLEIVREFLRVTVAMGGDTFEQEFEVNFTGELTRVIFSVIAGAAITINGYATDAHGNTSVPSNTLSFTSAVAVKPPPPNDVATGPVSGFDSAHLPVTWTAPDDDDEDGIGDLIGGYLVSGTPSTSADTVSTLVDADKLTAVLAGLPFDTESVVGVQTVDIWGNKSDPETVTKTPALLGPNLVINGGMEKESASLPGLPEKWGYDSGSNADQVHRNDAQAHEGAYSLYLSTQDIGVGIIARAVHDWFDRPVVPGGMDLYTAGFWLYDISADPNDLVVSLITQDESTGDPIYTEIDTIALPGGSSGGWIYYEYKDIAPGVTYLRRMSLAFGLDNEANESIVYIDDVSFRQQLVTYLSSAKDGTIRGEQFDPKLNAEVSATLTGRAIDKPVIDAYPADGADADQAVIRAAGVIESTEGGVKFPDGKVQTIAAPYDICGYFHSVPADGELIWTHAVARTFTLPSDLAGSQAYAYDPAAGHDDAVFIIVESATGKTWTMTFVAASNMAVFANGTATGDVTLNAGDNIQIIAPSPPPDDDISKFGWTLVGILP